MDISWEGLAYKEGSNHSIMLYDSLEFLECKTIENEVLIPL